MRRTWQIAVLGAMFLTVVLAALGWVTLALVRMRDSTVATRHQAALEETVRLALWRMDAAIFPMIVEENSRPYFDYWALNTVPAPGRTSATLSASSLLTASPSNVHVYFNGVLNPGETGVILSPQVPTDDALQWVKYNLAATPGNDVMAAHEGRLKVFRGKVSLDAVSRTLERDAGIAKEAAHSQPLKETAEPERTLPSGRLDRIDEQQMGNMEFEQRVAQNDIVRNRAAGQNSMAYSNLADLQKLGVRDRAEVAGRAGWNSSIFSFHDLFMQGSKSGEKVGTSAKKVDGGAPTIDEGVMRPFWVGDMLVLARRVRINEREVIQGAWLNWEAIQVELLARIRDLFPQAQLAPVPTGTAADPLRQMASLPVRLEPGQPAILPALNVPSLRLPLWVAWTSVSVAMLAVAILLIGSMRLSERRGAFVSAVTHELRTPLTTFRMYTEMLAEGMVPDKSMQQEYLETLHSESGRLGHLVENVLAYARLERGTGSRVLETVSVGAMLERSCGLLNRRATESEMTLVLEMMDPDLTLHTNAIAVEQILFNLVDNAGKYARDAVDRRIHLGVMKVGRQIQFRVSDHGSGLTRSERRVAFKPFVKSATRAAQSAPGVGLGLALCRRLARQLGGDVGYEERSGYGACFVLRLPGASAIRCWSGGLTAALELCGWRTGVWMLQWKGQPVRRRRF